MYFRKIDRQIIDNIAIESLYEALYTFKPGLNCTEEYKKSIEFLRGSFAEFFDFGAEYSCVESGLCFDNLRLKGRAIENIMLDITSGVHTHIGALFSMGLLACAAGKLDALGIDFELDYLITTIADYTRYYSYKSFINCGLKTSELTTGEKLYLKTGQTSIRGLAEEGFRNILEEGTKFILKNETDFSCHSSLAASQNTTDSHTRLFLLLVSMIEDSNILLHNDPHVMSDIQYRSKSVFDEFTKNSALKLDQFLTESNLTPKASMGMLSLCLFSYKLLKLKKSKNC